VSFIKENKVQPVFKRDEKDRGGVPS
jgi:hypothetical protein